MGRVPTVDQDELSDDESFLAWVAREDGEAVAGFFRRLFSRGSRAQAELDWGTGPSLAIVGWYLLDGIPSTVWVATAGGVHGRASLGVWLAEMLPYVPASQLEEVVRGFEEVPLLRAQAKDADASEFRARCFARPVSDLLAHPAQVDQLFDAFDRVAAAEADMRAPFRSFISPYEWGERGEHGG